MAGDYSRNTFDPGKHYSRVLMQQGRVQLDSDWNEQGALIAHRIETESRDVIGLTGAPKAGGNFRIGVTPDGSDLTIAPGRIYVDGLLCENESAPVTAQATAGTSLTLPTLWLDGRELASQQWLEVKIGNNAAQVLKVQAIDAATSAVTLAQAISGSGTATVRRVTTYLTQPDLAAGSTFANFADGRYLVYLDVFEREISAIDDPNLREIALGGPDTARRLETVWRVALLAVPQGATCDTAVAPLAAATTPSNGLLAARTAPPDDEPDPCLLPPGAGFRGIENQLYRIEIQDGGQLPSANPPTFKWSRDNATIEAAITNVSGATVTVSEIGKDDVLRFNTGDWVEIVDDASVLSGSARALTLIDDVTDATRVIAFAGAPAIPPTGTRGLRLRKWDQNALSLPMLADTWSDVEAGVQVRFSPGLYHSGDYWLIPARTAIADVLWPPHEHPATSPVPQPPLGVRHHYARLGIAAKAGQSFTAIEDCRDLFPPLTDIWAEDVNFDNTHCQLAGADTVQEALDALCERTDIRTHNKFLHGWGVVCGLQVRCAGDTRVRVLPGYALDCEGFDIQLRQPRTLDITTLPYRPASLPSGPVSLPPNVDEVCLVLERGPNGQAQFRLTDHDHRDSLREILEGTLLVDFYEKCLKPFSDFFLESLDPRDKDPNTVSNAQSRGSAVWNLLIQLWNPTNGGRVWLSHAEHDLLLEFYEGLKRLSASTTFCTLLDSLRDPPEYPFDAVPMQTIFSKRDHTRVRAAADGRFFVTMGTDDRINVFQNGRMVHEIEFFTAGATVRDVAFMTPQTFAAVATLPDGSSAIGVHDVLTGTWRQQTTIPGHEVVTLAFSEPLGTVYGVSLNQGLMVVTLGKGARLLDAKPHAAKGHLVLLDQGENRRAALTSRIGADAFTSSKYNSIAVQFLSDSGVVQVALNREGDDDMSPIGAPGQETLAVVVDPIGGQTTKQLILASTRATGSAAPALDLLENTKIRLGWDLKDGGVAVVYEDSYHLRHVTDFRLDPEVDIPVQICPSSIAVTRQSTFVLNSASRTVTEIRPPVELEIAELRQYRREMLDAFIDLGAAVFQSIKDCFCERLLIDCDTCAADDVIILACLELDKGRVRQICNLAGRKYVKTFRGVEYWLSLVPVLPLLRWVLEKFCCLDLSAILRKVSPPTEGPNRFDCGDALPILAALEKIDFKQFRREAGRQASFVRKIGVQSVTAFQPAKERTIVDPAPLVGQNLRDAEAQLKASGIEVATTEAYDARLGRRHLTRALRTLRPGMNVTIVQRNGRVAYLRETTAALDNESVNRVLATTNSDMRMLRADLEAQRQALDERQAAITEASGLRGEVAALRNELDQVRIAHQSSETLIGELKNANIAAEARIGELSRRTADLLRTASDLDTLKRTVETLRRFPNG